MLGGGERVLKLRIKLRIKRSSMQIPFVALLLRMLPVNLGDIFQKSIYKI